MTRAKKFLYMTWARDYGLKRLKKVSPFVLEVFDLSKMSDEVLQTSPLEEIKRYAEPAPQPKLVSEEKVEGILTLSYFQVDDYLTCPLRYKYRHIMRIPVLPHHNLIFGRVLHNTIHFYLHSRMSGKKLSLEKLLDAYEERWINEGFLSREHEEMRKKAGRKAMRRFYRREEDSGQLPRFLEKSFKWQMDEVKFIGRWDRIDLSGAGAVIVDYKATEIKGQKEADKRTRDSLQMDLYALSFLKTQEASLVETQLHFLESDIIGHASKEGRKLDKAVEKIKEAETGIRAHDFDARPDWHNCSFCDFRMICPSSYAY
jgi:DNA helicase-2/ATP-dependent DNA helicase PcrA